MVLRAQQRARPYITQVLTAISQSDAIVLILSKDSFASLQVDKEIIQAYEGNKPFIPLLHGITHADFRAHKPEWGMMLGASTSVAIPAEGVSTLIPRMVEGLTRMGLPPGSSSAITHAAAARPRSDTPPIAPTPPALAPVAPPAHPETSQPSRAPSQPIAVATATSALPRWGAAAAGVLLLLVVGGFVVLRSVPSSSTPAVSPPSAEAPAAAAAGAGAAAAPAPPQERVISQDDFSDPAKSYFAPAGTGATSTNNALHYDRQFQNGQLVYRITESPVNLAGYSGGLPIAEDAFAVEVQARIEGGVPLAYGIPLNFAGSAGGIRFNVNPLRGSCSFFRNVEGQVTGYGCTPGPSMNKDASPNTLRLEVRGDKISALVNGNLVGFGQDDQLAARPVRLYVAAWAPSDKQVVPADNAAVAFSQFRVLAL